MKKTWMTWTRMPKTTSTMTSATWCWTSTPTTPPTPVRYDPNEEMSHGREHRLRAAGGRRGDQGLGADSRRHQRRSGSEEARQVPAVHHAVRQEERKSTRLNSSHSCATRIPSSA